MKNYARDFEPHNLRNNYPDKGDMSALALPSREGKQRSSGKRYVRRYWNRVARSKGRTTTNMLLEEYYDDMLYEECVDRMFPPDEDSLDW
jgi:hypothetical protein